MQLRNTQAVPDEGRPFVPDLYDNRVTAPENQFRVFLGVLTEDEHKSLRSKGILRTTRAGKDAAKQTAAALGIEEDTIQFIFQHKVLRVENLVRPNGSAIETGIALLIALREILAPAEASDVIEQIVTAVTQPSQAEAGFMIGSDSQPG